MAVVAGTVTNVFGHTAVGGPKTDSAGDRIYQCYVAVTITGTYAQADDASVLLLNTAIANSLRSGKTINLRDASWVAPGIQVVSSADVKIGASGTAISSTTMTFALTDQTFAAEYANATSVGTTKHPLIFSVTYETDE